ncbi:DUF6153 family protein [Streptomyces sp. NPDC006527]|uniref:DUF6153 family protein n=1 Tax=Streptomyces sp. NPDC006527 TaxID=3364749 RepID=UPI00369D011A
MGRVNGPGRRMLGVLGLLVGLLGMHGLAPGGTVHEHASSHLTAAAVTVAHDGCGDGGHCGGGHLRHADATCASGAVSGAPELPALVPDPSSPLVPARAACADAAADQDGARAPPSLSELQLLRI